MYMGIINDKAKQTTNKKRFIRLSCIMRFSAGLKIISFNIQTCFIMDLCECEVAKKLYFSGSWEIGQTVSISPEKNLIYSK